MVQDRKRHKYPVYDGWAQEVGAGASEDQDPRDFGAELNTAVHPHESGSDSYT